MANQQNDKVTAEDMRSCLVNRWSASRLNGLREEGIYDQVLDSTAKNMADLANKLMAEEGRNRLEAEHLAWQAYGI